MLYRSHLLRQNSPINSPVGEGYFAYLRFIFPKIQLYESLAVVIRINLHLWFFIGHLKVTLFFVLCRWTQLSPHIWHFCGSVTADYIWTGTHETSSGYHIFGSLLELLHVKEMVPFLNLFKSHLKKETLTVFHSTCTQNWFQLGIIVIIRGSCLICDIQISLTFLAKIAQVSHTMSLFLSSHQFYLVISINSLVIV